MRSRILLGTLFGTVGGFFAFLLQELFTRHDPNAEIIFRGEALFLGWLIGMPIGIAIGAVEGAALSSPRLLARGIILGGIIGGIGGAFGSLWSSYLFSWALLGRSRIELENSGSPLDFAHIILARGMGFTLLGALPGLAAGAATLSRKRALHGLLGGVIGGLIGGILFDPIAKVIAPVVAPILGATSHNGVYEAGGPSRAIGFTIMGMLIGLFIGLVEDLLKQAWVRVLAGRNEGKDYIIGKVMTILGRDERADVPLFGDPTLAPQHAAIRMEHGRHTLLDGGAPAGSVVNGQRIQQQLLRDGDMIQLGQVRLLFREKATAARVGRPAPDVPKSAQAPGALAMPSHLCPFCGAAKDANGNCLCTVPGIGQQAASMPTTAPASAYGMGSPIASVAPGYGDPSAYGSPVAAPQMSHLGSALVALDGPYAGQRFALAAPNVTIGRGPENTIPMVNDVTVSRHHAHITEESGRHVLYDDGSSNGTFVNGVRVTIQPLAPGDMIQFGASHYRYE